MANRILILLIILVVTYSSASAQAPKYSNEFLSVGIGARSLAMANASIASTSDANSAYWNPAGLTLLKNDMQISAMHAEYFAGMAKYDYLGAAFKQSDSACIGFSLIRFGVDDIPNTLDLIDNEGNIRYDQITSFSVADYAFLFSYARKLRVEGLQVGGNVKIIRRITGDFASAWGFGFDAGVLYKKNKWSFGATARDVTSTFNAWTYNPETFEETFILTGNEIPENGLEITMPKLLLGCAYHFDLPKKFSGLAEVDADVTFDGKRNVLVKSDPVSIDPHLGVEFSYNNLVYLRAGVGNVQKIPEFDGKESLSFQPNLGIGIRYKRFGLDYAITDIGDQSIALYSNVFSIFYSIDKKPE